MLTTPPELLSDSAITNLAPVSESLKSFTRNLVIKNAATYEAAAERLKAIKGALAQIEDARTRITRPLNESLRETNAQAKLAAAPFLADEQTIKRAMVRYSDEQEKLRAEEQRRANEVAERERRRLQAIADEAARKAEAEAIAKRRAAEEAAAAGRAAEAAKLAAQAHRIEEKGAAKVEQFENRAGQVVAPVSQAAAPKVAGIAVPLVWDFTIENPALIPREWCDVSETRIRRQVNATQGNTRIPGVRVFQRKRIASSSA